MDDYDVIIIGAGLSGLAAGIRLAYYDRRVCILERHYAYGGMNSYYTIDGRKFDVGLHAVTNFVPRGAKSAPLTKLLRQLRIEWHELDLHPQHGSEVRFPKRRLRFTNEPEVLVGEIAREFPSQLQGLERLVSDMRSLDDTRLDAEYLSTRAALTRYLTDPTLVDMFLCPIMFYGGAEEHDMEFHQFATMFKSIFLQGLARPSAGVRSLLTLLVRKFRSLGGKLRMQSGVERLETKNGVIAGARLDSGERLRAKTYFSCAGFPETMRLCDGATDAPSQDIGRLSFVETIAVLDRPPRELGHDRTIVFFNDRERFVYARPTGEVDLNSGIVCCPNNYDGLETEREFQLRLTWIANYERWKSLSPAAYRTQKDALLERAFDVLERHVPDVRRHTVATDMFTPRTIEHFTGRLQGAVYGSPTKHRDGRTPFSNLFVCGTDQGFLGIIGAMLSGIAMANLHVLSEP